MKTIDQAAMEYAETLNYSIEAKHNMSPEDFIIAFNKGIEFVEQMIPVTEELPSEGNGYINKPVIIEDEHGRPVIGIYSMDLYWSSMDELIDIDHIASWRPINRK